MKKLAFVGIIIIILLSISIIFFKKWDYREVKLQYIGEAKVEPPLIEILDKDVIEDGGWWSGGRTVEQVKAQEWWINHHSKKRVNKINWDHLSLRDGENYYVCVGCRLEQLTYFYHTKFTNPYSKSLFKVESVKLVTNLERSVLTIYKGDVDVVWIPEKDEE